MASPPPPLLYADPEQNADALYFGRVSAPDPFIAFSARGKKYAVVSALEFARVRRRSDFDRVIPLEPYANRARRLWPRKRAGAAEVIWLLAKAHRQRRFTVAEDFPAAVYRRLRNLGLGITIADGPLFPEREIKTSAEIAAIREGNRCSALGIAAAERILRASRIRGGRLYHGGSVLTSERLKSAIEIACLQAGALSAHTIAAGGNQACDPHEGGTGPLRANELIILDVFPRVVATGYFGDMTRTFLRGRASEAQRALVEAVRAAQLAALGIIRVGVSGKTVHEAASRIFKDRGYRTGSTAKGPAGFFHGTGHGVGLAIHELPRVNSSAETPLKRGTVVTVEPGLYYRGIGGCRIEDVVQVTAGAPRLLSSYPYDWQLR